MDCTCKWHVGCVETGSDRCIGWFVSCFDSSEREKRRKTKPFSIEVTRTRFFSLFIFYLIIFVVDKKKKWNILPLSSEINFHLFVAAGHFFLQPSVNFLKTKQQEQDGHTPRAHWNKLICRERERERKKKNSPRPPWMDTFLSLYKQNILEMYGPSPPPPPPCTRLVWF